jgi:hypothetical protein
MSPISYSRHRFPPVVIQHAVWLYLRFTLSYRDVEELLAERGLDVSYETVRSWVLKFGPMIARRLRQRRPRPSDRWHLCENCGSPLYSQVSTNPERIGLRVGSLDDPSIFRPDADIFVKSAQPCDYMNPAVPKYDTYPPGKSNTAPTRD